MKYNNTAGFSLVELMVVVGIIGILATIAVPSFMKFQAKAKQSNAKAELAGIYTAQMATFVEHNSFEPNLAAAGYVPAGFTGNGLTETLEAVGTLTRLYNVGIGSSSTVTAVPGADSTVNRVYGAYINGTLKSVSVPTTSGINRSITAVSFRATAAADLGKRNGSAVVVDLWTIDNNKSLINAQLGY